MTGLSWTVYFGARVATAHLLLPPSTQHHTPPPNATTITEHIHKERGVRNCRKYRQRMRAGTRKGRQGVRRGCAGALQRQCLPTQHRMTGSTGACLCMFTVMLHSLECLIHCHAAFRRGRAKIVGGGGEGEGTGGRERKRVEEQRAQMRRSKGGRGEREWARGQRGQKRTRTWRLAANGTARRRGQDLNFAQE